MTIEEFVDTILKKLYVEIAKRELIKEASALAMFEKFKKQEFYKMVDYIVYKSFMHDLKGEEVDKLRAYIHHDFTLGSESYFE